MKILITGASGFLGTHLINYLNKKKVEIFNFGRKSCENANFIELKSCIDNHTIDKTISKIEPDCIFHLAGTTQANNTNEIFSVNTNFCSSILGAVKKNGLDKKTKIMIVGSAAEYGLINEKNLPISEDFLGTPFTDYGKSKLKQTKIAIEWQKKIKQLVVIRPFNIIGSNMPKHLAVGSFQNQIDSIKNTGELQTGNLDVQRDFVDVDDVIDLMFTLINKDESYGEIINICKSKPILLREIVNSMIKISGKNIKIKEVSKRIRKDDVPIHYGCNAKLLSIVGDYKFKGIDETIINLV